MTKNVIIVAGGKGKRMGSEIPKQFIVIGRYPIVMHTIKKFHDFDSEINIILALPESEIDYWENLCTRYNFNIKHKIAKAGKERFFSVRNALRIAPDAELTAIHDGVRPFVSLEVIKKGFDKAQKYKTAIAVINENNSVRIVKNKENKYFDRNKIRLVQTPQIFETKILKEAYQTNYCASFTDDASVVEANGNKIFLFAGNIENIKITTKFDLEFANYLLAQSTK